MDLSPLVNAVKEFMSVSSVETGHMDGFDHEHWKNRRQEARQKIFQRACELVERTERERWEERLAEQVLFALWN